MTTAAISIRLLLFGVFGLSGVTKVLDRRRTRVAFVELGSPAVFADAAAIGLPLVELVIAALLLVERAAWVGCLAALVILVGFVAVLGWNLRRGRAPTCYCFGQLSVRPIGWITLTRNALFVALAGFTVSRGPSGIGPGIPTLLAQSQLHPLVWTVGGAALLAIVVEGALVARLFQENRNLVDRVDSLVRRLGGAAVTPGLAIGKAAPHFELPSLHDDRVALGALLAGGRRLMLVFVDPHCGACSSLGPDLAAWQEHDKLTLSVVSRGSREANAGHAARYGWRDVLLQRGFEVAHRYGVPGTPSAVIIEPTGIIGSRLATGAEAIRALVGGVIGNIDRSSTVLKAGPPEER